MFPYPEQDCTSYLCLGFDCISKDMKNILALCEAKCQNMIFNDIKKMVVLRLNKTVCCMPCFIYQVACETCHYLRIYQSNYAKLSNTFHCC